VHSALFIHPQTHTDRLRTRTLYPDTVQLYESGQMTDETGAPEVVRARIEEVRLQVQQPAAIEAASIRIAIK
jgi:hypothetical protein